MKSTKESLPRKTVYRLSLYLRGLDRLAGAGAATVSSETLAEAAGVKSTQLRKDLAFLGHFGTRGLGYNTAALRERLLAVLRRSRLQPVVLAGAGHLGAALLGYGGFAKEGFEILAAFDVDPAIVGTRLNGIPVLAMENLAPFVTAERVRMAILTAPAAAAQEVADRLVVAGVKAILNFAPLILQTPPGVTVKNVNLAIELENLGYFLDAE